MICPNCKTNNADDAVHCVNCGELLDADSGAQEENKSAKIEEIQQRRQKKKRRQKRNKIIVIVLAAAAVAAVIYGAFYWIQNNVLDRTVTDDTLVVSQAPAASALPSETPTPEPTETAQPSESAAPSENTDVESWQAVGEGTAAPTASAQDKAVKAAEKAAQKPVATAKASAGKTTKATAKASAGKTTKATAKPAVSSPGFTAGTITTTPVKQGETMTSQLVKASGSETDESGRTLIKLSVGGSTYYAYDNGQFSGGNNAYYSLDASASANSYNGAPVYNVSNVVVYDASGYILPESSSRVLTDSDVAHLSKSELVLARNEIYARHGRTFKKQELQEYFNSKTWYSVNKNYNYSNDSLNLNAAEKANVRFLRHKAE